jgi:hypothetical protein
MQHKKADTWPALAEIRCQAYFFAGAIESFTAFAT